MTCTFRSRALSLGWKLRVEFDAALPKSDATELLETSRWNLESFDSVAGWSACEEETLLAAIPVSEANYHGEFVAIDLRVSHLVHDVTYRVSCDSEQVESSHNLAVCRHVDPHQIDIELEGFGSIPWRYIDLERSSESFSQRINFKEGKTDIDGISLYLVDLDERWTAAFDLFGLERTSTAIENAVDDTDTDIELSDATGFAEGQKIYIESECVLLGEQTGNQFSSCTRGVCFTKPDAHSEGVTVFSVNPFWVGRIIQIREGGNLVWSGVLVRVEPEGATSVALEARSLLAMLDTRVNRNRGTAMLADLVWVDRRYENGTWQVCDRVYASLTFEISDGQTMEFTYLPVTIPTGFYDIREQSLGTDRSLVTALAKSLDENLTICTVTGRVENGCACLSFRADRPFFQSVHVVLDSSNRADPYLEEREDTSIYYSSLLERLGFESKVEFDVEDVTELEAGEEMALRCGLGKMDRVALLAPYAEDPESGAASFSQGPGYALIGGEELVGYSHTGSQQEVFASTTLVRALSDAEDTTVVLQDGISFHTGNLVRIEGEYVILSDSRLEMGGMAIFQNCTRGALSSQASSHAEGSVVDKIHLDALFGLERGCNGVSSYHAVGASIQETWRGGMNPREDLQNLLDEFDLPASVSEFSCRIGVPRLLSPMAAYDRWADEEETYLELACDICRAFFVWFATDAEGKLCLSTIQPLLRHESPDFTFNASSVISPPIVSYMEGESIGTVSMEWGKKGGEKSSIKLCDYSQRNHRLTRAIRESLEYSLECLSSSEALMHVYRLARKMLFVYSHPKTEVELETTWNIASRLALFDRVRLEFPQLAIGRGERGINASTTHWIVSEIEKNLSSRTARICLLEGITGVGWNFSCVVDYYDPALREIVVSSSRHLESLDQIEEFVRAGDKLMLVKAESLEGGAFVRTRNLTVLWVEADENSARLRFTAENFMETSPGEWWMQDEAGNPVAPVSEDVLTPSLYDENDQSSKLKQLVFCADEYAKLGSEDDSAFCYTI